MSNNDQQYFCCCHTSIHHNRRLFYNQIHGASSPINIFDMAVPLRDAPKFTQQQKEDLQRLWKAQSNDAQDGGNAPDRVKKITTDCDTYTKRLYGFAFGFLKKHTGVQSRGQQTITDFLKDNLRESCLESFYSRFVEKSEETNEKRVRLNGEKVLIMLHHDEFMSELNQYEYRGKFNSDDEDCIKFCYGAFLYHCPLEALPALNVAMGLAVVSLWRLVNNEGTIRSSTEKQAVDRFLDFCRIDVRFVHVKPHLPMADIKTGLLKKLITVKGHVVKARPRRLRVSTADL